jgi:hypothetical protein
MRSHQKGLLVLVGFVAGAVLASHHARLSRLESHVDDVELQVSAVRGEVNQLRATAPGGRLPVGDGIPAPEQPGGPRRSPERGEK